MRVPWDGSGWGSGPSPIRPPDKVEAAASVGLFLAVQQGAGVLSSELILSLRFGRNSGHDNYLGSGWSDGEDGYRWMTGERSALWRDNPGSGGLANPRTERIEPMQAYPGSALLADGPQ